MTAMSMIINNVPGAVQLFVWSITRKDWVFDCEADNRDEYKSLLACQRHYEREGKLTKIEGNPLELQP